MATLGEHTRAYLKETGLTEDEIAAFAGKPAGGGAALIVKRTVTQALRLFIRSASYGLAAASVSSQSDAMSSTIRNTGRTANLEGAP